MNKNFTYIAILLDRSGSMARSERDVIGGVNTFLKQQRVLPGKAHVSIMKFDDVYETIYEDVDIKKARDLTDADFVPRNGTHLFDATMRMINETGAKLAAMKEKDRPGQVILFVFSDGGENGSKEIRDGRILQEKVKHQETVFSWKFLFFGMEIDGLAVGGSIGIKGMSTGSKTSGGISRGVQAASAYVGQSRLGNHGAAEQLYASNHVDDPNARGVTEDFLRTVKKAEDDAAKGDSKP